MLVWVRVVFRKAVIGDRRFNYLSGSHLQGQVKSLRQMPLVVVLIGQFGREVIGCEDFKVAVTGQIKTTTRGTNTII